MGLFAPIRTSMSSLLPAILRPAARCYERLISVQGSTAPVTRGLMAKASTSVDAPPSRVWRALVDPELIRQYMFGTEVEPSWEEGAPHHLEWDLELEAIPGQRHHSQVGTRASHPVHALLPALWPEDIPENHHTVTVKLSKTAGRTLVTHAGQQRDRRGGQALEGELGVGAFVPEETGGGAAAKSDRGQSLAGLPPPQPFG